MDGERKLGGKPTLQELELINKFALRELSEDEVYVLNPLMIDDQETSYHSMLHINLLNKIMRDTVKGAPLILNHNNSQLPVGRSFDSKIVSELDEEGNPITSVSGKFYIDLGRNTQGGMTTDDIAKGVDSGTLFDVSIGFNFNSCKCSICGYDIRDYMNCSHMPGETYEVKGEDEVYRKEKCVAILGEDGEGELLELSLVYAGACNRATIKQNFVKDNVRNTGEGTKLEIVDNFKNIPKDARIFQYYTKDGSVLFTDTPNRTNGVEYLEKRSEEKVEFEKLLSILSEAGIKETSEEGLSAKLKNLVELETKSAELTTELENVKTELETTKEDLSKRETTIEELVATNNSLAEKADLIETYKTDLINETLESGIRVNGNSFNKELFEKFLNTLSIDEIKEAKSKFDEEVKTKLGGGRVSKPEDKTLSNKGNEDLVPDKDNEPEAYDEFVASKAVTYAKDNNVSIKEALILMNEKYSKRSE